MQQSFSNSVFDNKSRYLDRFGLLLVITVGAIVVQSLVDIENRKGDLAAAFGYVVVTTLVGAMLVLALRASGASRTIRTVTEVIVGLGILAALATFFIDVFADVEPVEDAGGTAPALAWFVMAGLAPLVVAHRLIQHRSVTRGTLMGAIAAFLLIAVAFKFAFLAIDEYQDEPFFGAEEPTTSFMYFSLVTATTLGYGDLSAATELGRLAAVTEAVIGQIFLVTFVAMLVGLLVRSWRPDERTSGD